MLLSKRSKSAYLQDLLNIIYANNSSVNGERHSVIDDVFLQPGSTVLSYLHSAIFYLDRLHVLEASSIENDAALLEDLQNFLGLTADEVTTRIEEDFDRLAESYSLNRIQGTAARGYVRFYSTVQSPISVPAGTQITTKTVPVVIFETVNEVVTQTPKYDSTTGLYYIDIAVVCTVVGTSGNLQPNRLTVLPTSVSGVVSVSNTLATVSGTAKETNTSLTSRIKIRRAGRSLPTRLGYKNLALGSGFALDAYVASKVSDSDLVTRDEANSTDVFIVTSPRPTTVTDYIHKPSAVYFNQSRFNSGTQETFPPSANPSTLSFVLKKQPVSRIVSVTVDSIPTSNFSLIKDISSLARSVRAFDKLHLTGVAGAVLIVVQYEYDEAIHELQNLMDAEENNVVNSNILVRSGNEIAIDFDITLDVISSYSEATVQANVEADIQKFFAGGTSSYGEAFDPKIFGERVDKSDLLRVALNVAGVDRIADNGFVMSSSGVDIVESLELLTTQYARIGTVTWI